jgi:hypothetical protein
MPSGREEQPSPKPSTSPGELASAPVPSRWMAVEIVDERVRAWNLRSQDLGGEPLPELDLKPWAALTPQGPVLVLAPNSWGETWEPGPAPLFRLQKDLAERISWVHLLQLEPLEDRRWLLWASRAGDLYVRP